MAIETCTRCGILFHQTIKDICPNCMNKEEEEFKKVRMYVKRHKGAELQTIAQQTNVELKQIIHFLQSGKITLGENAAIGYPCSQCNAIIFSGAHCIECSDTRQQIQKSLQSATSTFDTSMQSSNTKKHNAFHVRD